MNNVNPLDRYLTVNASYGNPIVFRLTRRGFFSEVNNLLNAALYGLVKKRRLIFDDTDFDGQRWSEYFTASLPADPPATVAADWIINGASSPHFSTIRSWAVRRDRRRLMLWLPQMRFVGSVQKAQRLLASALTQPRRMVATPDDLALPFVAFQVRRGDKVNGYMSKGKLIREGDDVDITRYFWHLNRIAPNSRSIFVMTDDYAAVEQIRSLSGERRVITLCKPDERGYEQSNFSSLAPEERARRLHRLVSETQIAARSDLFIGGFKSNVARFVALWHAAPKRCVSIDRQTRWSPG